MPLVVHLIPRTACRSFYFFFYSCLFCTWARASSVSPDVSIAPQWLRLSRCSLGTLASHSSLSVPLLPHLLLPWGGGDGPDLPLFLSPLLPPLFNLFPLFIPQSISPPPLPNCLSKKKPFSPSLNVCGAPRGTAPQADSRPAPYQTFADMYGRNAKEGHATLSGESANDA